MKGTIVVIVALIIGFAVGLFYAQRWGKKNVTVLNVQPYGEIDVHTNKGEVIEWHGTKVNFDPFGIGRAASPCFEQGDIDTCHVAVTKGEFVYKCVNLTCPDPGVGVGSNTMSQRPPPSPPGPNPPVVAVHIPGWTDPPNPAVYCKNQQAMGQDVTGTASEKIQWQGVGQIQNWQVTVSAGTCAEGTTFNSDSPQCTLTANPPTQAYKIDVTDGNGRACEQGTANLVITTANR